MKRTMMYLAAAIVSITAGCGMFPHRVEATILNARGREVTNVKLWAKGKLAADETYYLVTESYLDSLEETATAEQEPEATAPASTTTAPKLKKVQRAAVANTRRAASRSDGMEHVAYDGGTGLTFDGPQQFGFTDFWGAKGAHGGRTTATISLDGVVDPEKVAEAIKLKRYFFNAYGAIGEVDPNLVTDDDFLFLTPEGVTNGMANQAVVLENVKYATEVRGVDPIMSLALPQAPTTQR